VDEAKPHRRPFRRLERAMLGAAMAVAAWVIERFVVRGLKRSGREAKTKAD